MRNPLASIVDVARSPRGLWIVIGAFVIEAMAYFGILPLMNTYFSADLGWPDRYASMAVSGFTMCVTLFMLGVGSVAESLGLRKSIALALLISTAGRALYCLVPDLPSGLGLTTVIVSLLIVAAGSGILQPTCYSGVKQFTTEKTGPMGYALIYSLMNLTIVGTGALSAWVRPGVDKILAGKITHDEANPLLQWLASFSGSGVEAMNWVCCGITLLTFVGFAALMTRTVEAARVRPDEPAVPAEGETRSLPARCKSYFTEGPFGNARFVFFVFMLLPVRTLFAHQWLTLPEYILRAYPQGVADRMEWIVDWINPLIVAVGVPLATMFTRRFHVYTMMIVGSLVSAVPTYLLGFGPDLTRLVTYLVLFSIGESLWSARFLEYVSDLAPPGRVSQYMGLGLIPWLLAKGTTGLYSGYLLGIYCPKGVPVEQLRTGTLWTIYASIAMLSPIGLWLARGWVREGLHVPE